MAEGIEVGHADQQCLLSPRVRHGVHTRADGLGGAVVAAVASVAAAAAAAAVAAAIASTPAAQDSNT